MHCGRLYLGQGLRYGIGAMVITSASNERIKHAKRVRDGRERDLIFVEGERLAEECVRSGLTIHACFHPPQPTERSRAIVARLSPAMVFPTADSVLDSLSDTTTTQGIILLADRPRRELSEALNDGPAAPLLVALDRIQDPGNLGSLVRTAEAAGAHGLIGLNGCADPFAPKSLRSAMGSAFRLPIITAAEPDEVLTFCQQHGVQITGATGAADIAYYDYDWSQPTLLVLGNEARGVSADLLDRCDVRLRIPLHAGVESLNVAAAGAAMLFEAVRQRRAA